MTTYKEVAATLEQFAPLPLQESYDNAGLQIGLTETEEVSGVLLCLDVTEDVIDEAASLGCNLIVAHHPLLFRGVKCIDDSNYVGRCIRNAILGGIGIYAAHTNLDNAPGGVNYRIAEKIGLRDVRFLSPMAGGAGGSGVIGELAEECSVEDFLSTLAGTFGVECVMHNGASRAKPIRRVALCGGAGEFLVDAAVNAGADAFITGEMGYHRYFGRESDILLAVLGHYQSEQYTVDLLYDILQGALPQLPLHRTAVSTNPIYYRCGERAE